MIRTRAVYHDPNLGATERVERFYEIRFTRDERLLQAFKKVVQRGARRDE